jgi:hypothetical protein
MAESATTRRAIWFYNLELALLADGGYHVSLTATTVDEEEPQLLCQEIFDERVASIDDALAVIKKGVTELR